MEWSLDPSSDWSSRPGPAPPSTLETEDHPSTYSVSAHDHEESYPAPSSAMVTERPGGQPLIDPVFSHGHGESCPASSPPLDMKNTGGLPQADPVLAHSSGEPYPASSPPTDTEFSSSQPPENPVFSHVHGGSYPPPSPPMDMEYPSGQPPIDSVFTHGHGESCPAPSLPVDTECPSSQPPIDPVFTHGYGEPPPAPSPPMDTGYPDGQPPMDPMFANGHGEPYLALSPRMDTEFPDQRMSTDRKILHELDVKHFRKVNSLIHHEMFDELLELIKIDRHPVNLMDDSVLCLVISAKKTQLAVKLIERVENAALRKENIFGNTPLHIAAVEGDITVAKVLLRNDWSLIDVVNRKGETALNKAAMYGHESMFWCLVHESWSLSVMYRTGDGSNMLHCAIMGNAPKLALDIAKRYSGLILSRDAAMVTPLQLMVTNPTYTHTFMESIFYKLIPLEEDSQSRNGTADEEVEGSINVEKSLRSKCLSQYTTILDLIELLVSWVRYGVFKIMKQFSSTMREQEEQKKRYAAAMQLVEYLAYDRDYDFYCKGYSMSNSPSSNAMLSPPDLEYASGEDAQEGDDATETTMPAEKDQLPPKTSTPNRWTEPPLIIAAERGLHYFVRKILQVCPQSATYLDSRGRNVLQVAVESGHNEVVSVLSEMLQGNNPILPSWLCSDLDPRSTENTILHLAAKNSPAEGGGALQLHQELEWFEMVGKIVPKELVYSRNSEGKTAHELFTERHKSTLETCKEQLVDIGRTCAGLVAMVVLTSSFSIPSEKDNKSGSFAFTIVSHAYMFGFGCAATALVLFLSLVLRPYKEQDFRRVIPMQFFVACLSFALALGAFYITVVCNIILQLYGSQMNTKHLIPLILELVLYPVACYVVLRYQGVKIGPSFFRFQIWK